MAKPPTAESVDRLITQKQLVALVRETGVKRKSIQSLVGSIGERVAESSEKHNLHRGVFTLMCKLAAMDDLKREDFIRQFPIYVDHCRKGKVFGDGSYGDLLERNETQADEEEQRASESATKAKPGDETPPPREDANLLSMVGRGKKRGKPPEAERPN
jgi:hypothetical protein